MKKPPLILILLASLLLCAAAEEERPEYTSGNYKYVLLEDGTAEITDYYGKETSLIVPEQLDGCTVSSIGDLAFSFCHSIAQISIPDNVVNMGANPFAYCHNLKRIKISQRSPYFAVTDGVLFDKIDKKIICYPCALDTDNYVIPTGILSIGDSAFADCSVLTEITIPNTVTSIGEYAFFNCSSLTKTYIPNSITFIDSLAFVMCYNIYFTVDMDSYAEQWAIENDHMYQFTNALDWLCN